MAVTGILPAYRQKMRLQMPERAGLILPITLPIAFTDQEHNHCQAKPVGTMRQIIGNQEILCWNVS